MPSKRPATATRYCSHPAPSQPLELISGVTLLGAGSDQTRVTGEAHFGLALRPFIQYFERPGEERGLQSVELRDVAMENFILDGGDEYLPRPAERGLCAVGTRHGH